jgi:hypothetical protein
VRRAFESCDGEPTEMQAAHHPRRRETGDDSGQARLVARRVVSLARGLLIAASPLALITACDIGGTTIEAASEA